MKSSLPTSLLAGVAAVLLLGCAEAAPGVASLLVVDARVVAGTPEILRITADLTNGTNADYARTGCLRPAMTLDSIAGTEWVSMGALQDEELIQCVRTFTVAPGATQRFEAQFKRAGVSQKFPRGTSIRLRVLSPPAELEPFFIFTLLP
jgi:hypothetical protein